MNVREYWSNFWFQESPYFDLAVLRLGAIGLQLFLLLAGTYNDMVLSVNDLPDELYKPLPLMQIFMIPWGMVERPDPGIMVVLFWIVIVIGIVALLGILTNLSLTLFATGYAFLQVYSYSFGDAHHPEAIMAVGLFALAFSPCGKVLSVDALIRQRFVRGDKSIGYLDYSGLYAGWPIKFMQMFIPLMYLSAVISKLARSGLDWANGFTLQSVLIQDGYRHGSELAIWASQFHGILKFSEWVVLAFQATFFLILFYPKLKWIYLPLGLFFHLLIQFTLTASFPQWVLFYAVYIPWTRVIQYVAQRRVTVKIAAPT